MPDWDLTAQGFRIFHSHFLHKVQKNQKIYSWVAEACGNELGKVMTKERIEQIVREKAELDLLS